jgi:VanZ family protein/ribosomal protein L37AE/L43A
VVSGSLRAIALRNIRIAAILYVLLILVGTHWPKLDLGAGISPADKLMHFIGFGLIVIAFWLAQWFTRWWTLLIAGMLFTMLDEVSQATISYGRVFSAADIVAGLMGVVVAVSLVHAFSPVGGQLARAGRARWIDAASSLLARHTPWMVILTGGALGVMIGAWGLLVIDGYYPRPNGARALLMGAALGGFVLAFWCFETGLRREATMIDEQHRCRGCARRKVDLEEHASGTCEQCGRPFEPSEWDTPALHARDAMVSSLFTPVLRAGVLLLVLAMIGLVLLPLRGMSGLMDLDVRWRALGFESQGVIDLMILGLVVAWTIRSVRLKVGARLDDQGDSCISCGQGLEGVPLRSGVGRCPECGSSFRRLETDVSSPQ